MHDSVAFQNVLQTVDDVIVLCFFICIGSSANTRCLVVTVQAIGNGELRFILYLLVIGQGQHSRLLTCHTYGVVVILHGLVARQEQGESGLHSLKVGVVVQFHVITLLRAAVVNSVLKHQIGLTDVSRCSDRGVVCRAIYLLHYIYSTVAGQQAGVYHVDVAGREHVFLSVIAQFVHL